MTKNLILFTMLLFSFVNISTQLDAQTVFQTFNEEWSFENWHTEDRSFPQGIYYEYIGKIITTDSSTSFIHYSIRNADMTIGFLIGKGIEIKEVWFKRYQSSCGPLDVVVDEVLIIRISSRKWHDDLESLGFAYQDEPKIGLCAYSVRHRKY